MAELAKAKGVAIVTGAARGIGAACAKALIEDGWSDVLLCDLNADLLEETARSLHNSGARIVTLAGDVTAPDFMERMIAACEGKPVAAAVHAAGVSPKMVDTPRMLEINWESALAFAEAVRPNMAQGGAVVMIASNTSYFPIDEELREAFERPLAAGESAAYAERVGNSFAGYLLAKRGVRALAKRQAVAFGDMGARIVSVSPGLIDTEMTKDRDTEVIQKMINESASKRVGDTAELAAVIAFLLSPKASFMTGCDVLVDGGETAGMGYQ
jgi:NAD(P)-dependent dehydrogenase (short-subunit alcohol dehydrogenase family)